MSRQIVYSDGRAAKVYSAFSERMVNSESTTANKPKFLHRVEEASQAGANHLKNASPNSNIWPCTGNGHT